MSARSFAQFELNVAEFVGVSCCFFLDVNPSPTPLIATLSAIQRPMKSCYNFHFAMSGSTSSKVTSVRFYNSAAVNIYFMLMAIYAYLLQKSALPHSPINAVRNYQIGKSKGTTYAVQA